ncbi:hypothetical protein [Anaerotignum sp. MB30-C6]|uniref:hypothetical protein n=1 Tax=Anaerotignum sp. MB30-C6 TaxID=3070814 RepID=UPI0027DD6469|nr:hypothetical protein [Anaerotignum sp. MB30-C6]WMI82115.1 hypothetical protein RBQ60_05105 [Anaerotignum sp. MB30-C6]
MGAFEFNNNTELSARNCGLGCGCGSNSDRGEVCIIAQKIFDQCRIQKCLTSDILGPARAARNPIPSCNEMLCEGDIIVPPCNAADVTIKDLELKRIEIIRKKPNPLQRGCWDIELKYVFEYTLEFRRADGCIIGCIEATNSYNLRVTLFGSTESDVTTATDLFECCGNSKGGPFVVAEGKALALAADLKFSGFSKNCGCNCGCGCGCGSGCNDGCCGDITMGAPVAVNVTIGLFTIVKLFRTVNMMVESLGKCIPESCTSTASSGDPCGDFESMCFPLDMFSPSDEHKSCCGFGPTFGSPK